MLCRKEIDRGNSVVTRKKKIVLAVLAFGFSGLVVVLQLWVIQNTWIGFCFGIVLMGVFVDYAGRRDSCDKT
jgi:hypothetical protein